MPAGDPPDHREPEHQLPAHCVADTRARRPSPPPPLGPTDWPTDRPNADEQTERPTGADRRGRGGTAGPVLTRVPTPVYRLVGMLMGPVFGAAAPHLIQYSLSFAAVLYKCAKIVLYKCGTIPIIRDLAHGNVYRQRHSG